MTVKSIKAVDYSTGTSYEYGDNSGNWQSIKSNEGQINSKGDPNAPASTASAAGSSVTSAASTNAISAAPITATTTKSGVISSATGSLVSMISNFHTCTFVDKLCTGNCYWHRRDCRPNRLFELHWLRW